MSSIPLPALDIRPPENPLDQYAKALSVKSMIGQGQIQQQELQGEQLRNQLAQRSIDDENAMTKSMNDWDGKDYSDLPSIVLKNGGSANAVFNLRKQILDQRQAMSKIALDDSTTGKNNLDVAKGKANQIAGSLESLVDPAQVPDDQLKTETSRTINTLLTNGTIKSDEAAPLQSFVDSTNDPKALRTKIDHFAKLHMGFDQLATAAKDAADTSKALAEASLANQKVKLYANSKPGDFDTQIDSLVPPTAANPNADLNQQAKTMVNGLLARGDYEGAAKALENTQHVLNERTQTNFVQNREDMRASLARESSTANQLQKNGLEQLDKIWTDPQHGYTQFLAQANATKTAIADAKDGNELAASLAPLMTVLGVNSFAGVHRINPQEYNAASSGVGSIYRRINTALDNAASGKLNSDTSKEMDSLVGQLIDQKFNSLLPASQLVARNAGLDPTKVTIFDKEGNPNTLDNSSKGISAVDKTVGNKPQLPAGNGKLIDKATAQKFYDAAGKDPDKARALAIQNNWKVQ